MTRPGLDTPLDGIPLLIVRLALTFAIAELSFRFVEMPIRRGAIDRWVRACGVDEQPSTVAGHVAAAP